MFRELHSDAPESHRFTFPTRGDTASAPSANAAAGRRRGALIEVRNSPVHGRGVFALAHIPEGTAIAEYTGEKLTWGQADARYADEHATAGARTYLMSLGKRYVLDAARSRCRAKWLNHACEPNCEALIDRGRVFIYTLRDVAPGEELFLDYALEGGEPEEAPLYRCLCGTPSCRGTMLALPPAPEAAAGPTPARAPAFERVADTATA